MHGKKFGKKNKVKKFPLDKAIIIITVINILSTVLILSISIKGIHFHPLNFLLEIFSDVLPIIFISFLPHILTILSSLIKKDWKKIIIDIVTIIFVIPCFALGIFFYVMCGVNGIAIENLYNFGLEIYISYVIIIVIHFIRDICKIISLKRHKKDYLPS